jgi:hypothetical protein
VRRSLSIAVAAVLAVVVIAVVVVAVSGGGGGGNSPRHLTLVRGVIGSEKKPFFADARVKAAFAKQGLDVEVDTAGSRSISTTVDLSKYDFAFPAGTPQALKIRADRKITNSYVPFFTPMAIATFTPIAQLLEKAGIAQDHGGWWSLDMNGFLDLVGKRTRWNQLPGNTTYPVSKFVLITSTDVATSNSAAMYASIASYAANGNQVLGSPSQVDNVIDAVSPLFVQQGFTEQSSEAPFDDYLSIGIGKTPMVMIYESQFVARAAAHDGSIKPDMVLMYPSPDILSKHTLVPLTSGGDRVGKLLQDDATLQHLAVVYGFRTARPGDFDAFVKQNKVKTAPQLLDIIEPPTYDTLEALIVRLDAALHASTTPTTPTTSSTP